MKPNEVLASGQRVFSVEDVFASAKALVDSIPNVFASGSVADAVVLQACSAFAEALENWQKVLDTSRNSVDDPSNDAAQPWMKRQLEQVRTIADHKATSLNGHAARAAVVLMLDNGRILDLANSGNQDNQYAIAALLVDLVASWPATPN